MQCRQFGIVSDLQRYETQNALELEDGSEANACMVQALSDVCTSVYSWAELFYFGAC